MFPIDFIFKQQENLVDNQKCQAGFRPLCKKIRPVEMKSYKIKTLVNLGKNENLVQVPQQQSNDINTAQISHNNQEQIPPPTKKRYGNFHSII